MARIRSPAHAPAMDPAWQRCRWQRGRDFALEPKLTALAMRIFRAKRIRVKLIRNSRFLSLVSRLSSLVSGLWSLVSGLWSLVFGLWSLVSGLCCFENFFKNQEIRFAKSRFH